MSREYDNRNRGALFRNSDKKSPNHPDYKGSLNVDGKEFWLDAWINEIRNGEKAGQKFMSVTVKPKMAREHVGATRNPPAQESAPKRHEDLDDDIPF
jgi:hypothetical protein